MALVISIAGTDRVRLVRQGSLRITSVLTNAPDLAEFVIPKFGDRTFAPEVGQEVIITNDGTRIFGGHVLEIDSQYDKLDFVGYRINCIDYTRHMDQRLVVDTYENQTVAAIVADIRSKYMPSDVDVSNVTLTTVIPYIAFNYEYPSDCLRQLAEAAEADWYIDYNKAIYFFTQNTQVSPFDLTDINGKYIYETLRIRQDLSQLRNVVFVRGGEFLANTTTAAYVAEANQKHYLLPYKFSDLQVNVTGQIKSVGVDPLDDEGQYDALHNFQEKMVKFRDDKKPSSGSAVRISGKPHLPVLVRLTDPGSIMTHTVREYVVIDKSIQTKEGARQRAMVELLAYKATLQEGTFQTYTTGLVVGQKINIQSTLRGIDSDFIINRIDITDFSEDVSSPGTVRMLYNIGLITTRNFSYINLLQRLLHEKKKEIIIDDNEIIDTIESAEESITLAEVLGLQTGGHNAQAENISIAETVTGVIDHGTIFVYGPQTPSLTKRLFILDGSRLG